jgi:hypothetical protein
MRYGLMAALLAFCGCAHEDASTPLVAAAPPKPQPVNRKPGATTEFGGTSAGCLMKAEIAESQSTDPNPFARMGTQMLVYRTWMRADGWVLGYCISGVTYPNRWKPPVWAHH